MSWWQQSKLRNAISTLLSVTREAWNLAFSRSTQPDGQVDAEQAIVEFLSATTHVEQDRAERQYREAIEKLQHTGRETVNQLQDRIREIANADYAMKPLQRDESIIDPLNKIDLSGLVWYQTGIQALSSTNVFAFAYDRQRQHLHIIFLNVRETEAFLEAYPINIRGYVYPRYYVYTGITPKEYYEFSISSSYGEWVWHNLIRNPQMTRDRIIHIWSRETISIYDSVPNPDRVVGSS